MVPAEIFTAAERCAGDDEFLQQIRTWLDSGGDVNDAETDDWDGQTLCLLGRCRHPHLARLLLERGADVNCVDEYGATPLYHASMPRRRQSVKLSVLLG
mmetsp:Transcript_9434/g.25079  ORF Transcript_9434/g.25079 Transcript_9434/m.25079 type:complete len:99 (-) Transcript_9434:609-905(-)